MAGPARMANREGEDKVAGADAGEEGDDDEDVRCMVRFFLELHV